jgi:hypothetical protein
VIFLPFSCQMAGNVGVPVEAEARGLLVEVIPRQLFVGDVAEGVWLVQGAVDKRHVSHGHKPAAAW